jgi:hypothetical protein
MRIQNVVTDAYKLDKQIKRLQEELKELKEIIKNEAKEQKTNRFEGVGCFAEIISKTETVINPKEFHNFMKKKKKEKDFFDLVGVCIGPTRKYLCEEEFDSISTKIEGSVAVYFKEAKIKRRIKK